jgi:peptidoglycan/LPS O-acetylase OafA/YrhL
MLAMWPTWLAGYFVFIHKDELKCPDWFIGILFGLGVVALFFSPEIRALKLVPVDRRPTLVGDYWDAAAFTMTLIAVNSMKQQIGVAWTENRILKYLFSLTFSLYLFHRPLIQVFASLGFEPPGSWQRRLAVIGGTLLIVGTVGYWAEGSKAGYRRAFGSLARRWNLENWMPLHR